MDFRSFIIPLGIATYILLATTVLLALFGKKIGNKWFKLHRLFAVLSITVATIHFILVLIIFGI